MQETDRIVIRGLEFYGFHGASDQEQTIGHRYLVDVTLWLDTRCAAQTDRLSDTVSYARVAKRIVQIGTQEQFRLIEALAGRLCDVVLSEFPAVHGVEMAVRKMCPPMNAIVASVGVEIVRTRTVTT